VLLAYEIFEALRTHALGERTLLIVLFLERGCIEEAHKLL
jgi:hypothetical protein